VNPITATGIDWEDFVDAPAKLVETEPAAGAGFAELPGFAMNAANYKQVEKDFAEWLYRNERADVFLCPPVKAWSKLGEGEVDFRARIIHQAHEARDAAIEKLRATAAKKVATLETRLRTAEGQLAKEKAESNSAKMQAGVSMLGGILGAVFGRKAGLGSITRGTSSISKATSAYKQHQDVANAEAKIEGVAGEIQSIQDELEAGIAKLAESFDPASLPLETESVKPAKSDVKVETVALLWLPHDARGGKAW
jgi:Skp family chaperone for outer membrane proteins